MIRNASLFVLLLLCTPVHAQMSLSDQINAVNAAQENEQARQQAMQSAVAARAAQEAAQQRAAQRAIEQQRIAAQAAIEQQRIATQAAMEQQQANMERATHEAAMADKKRQQSYEDEMRDLQIQEAKLKLLEEQQRLTSDKQRDQAYQDKLREIEVQQKAADLKRLEVRASRENDFIDRDLHHQDAQTDVIQSGADATRNLSEGAKTLLQDAGTAAIKNPVKAPELRSSATARAD